MFSSDLRIFINAKWFVPLFICIVLSTSLFNISKASADVSAGSPYLVLTLQCGDSGVIFYPSGASNPVSVGATMTPVSNITGPSINARTISSLTVTASCSAGAWSGVATSGTVTSEILTKTNETGGFLNTTLTDTLGVSVGITQYATFSTSSAFASFFGINRVSLPSVTPAFTLSSSTETVNAASAIVGYTITSTGGAIDSYSISPAISNGLSFSTTTGLISGTPTAQATAVTYTITATNTAGSSTATYSLTVNADPAIAAAAEAARLAAVEAARLAAVEAARVAAANAEAARKAKEQKELTEILAIIPKIAELTLGLGETTKSLYSTKCVKGKTTKYVKYGAKCPKGYKKK